MQIVVGCPCCVADDAGASVFGDDLECWDADVFAGVVSSVCVGVSAGWAWCADVFDVWWVEEFFDAGAPGGDGVGAFFE